MPRATPTWPWFRFDALEWLASREIRLLTAAQRGYLIQLLAESWQSEVPGTVPADPSKLWRLAGARSQRDWERAAGPVMAQFALHGGWYVSARLLAAGQEMHELSATRSQAAQAKWLKTKVGADAHASANALQPQCDKKEEKEEKKGKREERAAASAESLKKLGLADIFRAAANGKTLSTPPLSNEELARRRDVITKQAATLQTKAAARQESIVANLRAAFPDLVGRGKDSE